ncbi:hypothetical protein [Oxalobacter paraformigenes]|uniref:hypothetical protein n=1 Tax=Oxalobacter paraformigenes TaxID=556268 RepID=UPI00031B45EA|nr:hypothetical protein [Oxalobacter paraformigenes]
MSALALAGNKGNRIRDEHGDMPDNLHPAVNGNVLALAFGNEKAKWPHKGTAPYPIRPEKGRALKFAGLYRTKVSHPGWPARLLLGFPMMRLMRSGIWDRITSGTCFQRGNKKAW